MIANAFAYMEHLKFFKTILCHWFLFFIGVAVAVAFENNWANCCGDVEIVGAEQLEGIVDLKMKVHD